MSETSQTVLEINLNSLSDNYHFLKSKLPEKTKFLGVVKAGAYGNDAISVAQKLQCLGADYLAVAYTQADTQADMFGPKVRLGTSRSRIHSLASGSTSGNSGISTAQPRLESARS